VRIEDFRREHLSDATRVSAGVRWEDSDRSAAVLHFETDGPAAEDLSPEPDAFLTAVALPAMRRGERRIAVEGSVSPRLRDGLRAAAEALRSWYGPAYRLPAIEPRGGFRPGHPRSPSRAAAMQSGGVDGLHMLLRNLREYPRDHPHAFQEIFSVVGLLFPGTEKIGGPDSHFARMRGVLLRLGEATGLPPTILTTNALRLEPDLEFLRNAWFSAALVAPAHALTARWSSLSIASAGLFESHFLPTGTHPLLEPNYSSDALTIRHEGVGWTRLDRLREIASWGPAVENLVVCQHGPPPPLLNCGACEKCIRTMTALLALDSLGRARQFPPVEIRPATIDALSLQPFAAEYWKGLPEALRRRGRLDLARAVERLIRRALRPDSGWRRRLGRLGRAPRGRSA
jgi:hypothetical protein